MGSFAGFVELGETLALLAQVRTAAGVPVNADALPTYRVYGPAGLLPLATGSLAKTDSGAVTGATNAAPIVVTGVAHGLSTGTWVTVSGVLGNTNANGTYQVTRLTADTFSLTGSTGSGSYTSGGVWNVTGLYHVSLLCNALSGYDSGETYTVLVTSLVGAVPYGDLSTFTVV